MPSEDRIVQAVTTPPNDTRATIRGKLIASGQMEGAEWVSARNRDGQVIRFDDPYMTSLPPF